MKLVSELATAEVAVTKKRFCSYCQNMRDVEGFKVRKGRPPMCAACLRLRAGRTPR